MSAKLLTDRGLTGLLFVAIGAVTTLVSYGYGLGTMQRIGPGFFPFSAGLLLSLIGLMSLLAATGSPDDEEVRLPKARALFPVLAILAFAVLIDRAGLLVTTVAAVLIARRAERWAIQLEEIVFAVPLALGCYLIFVRLLGMSMRLLPAGL